MGLREDFSNWLSRRLAEDDPQAWVEGRDLKGSDRFSGDAGRELDALEQYEQIYNRGGAVAQLVDIKANMVFGTGVGVSADVPAAAEWLERQLPQLDNTLIEAGKSSYIYGDAFYRFRETRAGGFSRLKEVDPKRVDAPEGEADKDRLQQYILIDNDSHRRSGTPIAAQDLAHIRLNQQSTDSPFGLSLIGRNLDEIQRFVKNQDSRQKFLRRHATPRLFVQVGREDGPAIDDRTLKRVRSRFQRLDDEDDIIAGRDVSAEYLDASTNDLDQMLEDDITLLAMGFGVPEEMAGLGRGSTEATAKVRLEAFEREARAQQRLLADQFANQVLKPILAEYSPFDPREANPSLEFGDPISDRMEDVDFINKLGDIMTVEEAREMVGLGPHEGDEDELGVFEEPSGGGGGLFMGSEGNGSDRDLVLDDVSESVLVVDDLLLDIQKQMVWDEEADPSRELFAFSDEDVPEFAKDLIRKAISSGAIFDSIDSISTDQRALLENVLKDSLEKSHGWSLESLTANLQDTFPDLEKDRAEAIARTETNSIVNHAREIGYDERENAEDLLFRWSGPDDRRTTEACEWIRTQVDSENGGAVTKDKLKELIQEANQRFVDHAGRTWTPHINCRHTFVRATGAQPQLNKGEGLTVRTLGHDTIRTFADIPDYLTDEISEDRFVPPEGAADAAREAKEYVDDNGAPNPDDQREGLARMNQLIDAVENNEPLAPEFVVEIAGFHARHRAQGNNECDESETLEPENIEGDHDPCLSDNGYFSDKTWGGDAAAEWAESLAERIEEVEENRDARKASAPRTKYGAGDWVLFEFNERERYGRINRFDQQSIELDGETVTGESDEAVYEIEIWSRPLERFISKVAMPESAVRKTAPPDNKEGATAD